MVRTVREPRRQTPVAAGSFWHDALAALRATGFLPLLVLFMLVTLGLGTVSTMLPFFLSSRLQLSPGSQTLLLALLFIAAALSVPLWTRLSARWGKRRAFAGGLVALSLGLVLLVGLSPVGELSAVLFLCTLLAGSGVGAVLLFPWALLPDVTAHDFSRTQAQRDGLFYALFTLCQTGAFALSAALSGGVLELSGYVSGAPMQSAGAVRGVSLLVGGVATGFFLLALLPLRRYRLR